MIALDTNVLVRTEGAGAIAAHALGNGDFADHLIAASAAAAGCASVATFDEELLKLPGFVAV